MGEVYIPGLGFRSDEGLAMRDRSIVERDGAAFAVMQLVSAGDVTRVVFEVRDAERQARCLGGTLDHTELGRMPIALRDNDGREYARTQFPNGTSLGQHDFGFFGRDVGFERLRPDADRVVLEVRGPLGDWTVPVDVVPIRELGFVEKRLMDARATREGITVRVTGIAFRSDETIVEFDVPAIPDGTTFGAVGEPLQRQRGDRLVLRDERGDRYVEELSRETVRRPHQDARAPQYAKFPRVPETARELTLVVEHVVIQEPDATAEVPLPVRDPLDLDFGGYRMRVHSAAITSDLLAPPGHAPDHGIRFAVGSVHPEDTRSAIRPARVVVDGKTHHCGWGWHPDPNVVNIDVALAPDARPASMTLQGAFVRVHGPWEVTFAVPR